MQKEVTISLEPGKSRPLKGSQFFQPGTPIPNTQINFVAMDKNEAVYRITIRSDDKLATRALKRAAKEAGLSLRGFVRHVVTFDDPSSNHLLELAQDWASRKGLVITEEKAA
jgi:hypothetical protein